MKILLYLILGIVSFVGVILLALALTGNLRQDALMAMIGKKPAETVAVSAPEDVTGLVAQLQAREEALKQKELQLEQREAQIVSREQSLAQMRADLEALQQQVDTSLDEDAAQRKVRLQTVAVTISSMKAKDAAERLRGFPTEEVAEILQLMEKAKDRADILSAMEPKAATDVLRALQGE